MRRYLTAAHRWMGLAIAAPLVVIGITGSMLALGPEIDAAVNPGLFERAHTGSPLDLDRLASRVSEQLPGARITFLAPARGEASVMLRVEARAEKAPLGFDQVFADPATGRLLGVRTWDSCGFSRAQVIPCAHRIHYSVLVPGMVGIILVGGIGLIWFVQQIIGLPLTFPIGRRPWKRWMANWRIDRRALASSYGVHRLAGLWTWLALTIVAITGVGISLETVLLRPLIGVFGALTPSIAESERVADPQGRPFGYEMARTHAIAVARAYEAGSAALPTGISHNPAMGYYSVVMEANPQSSGFGPSWYHIDDRDGAMLAAETIGNGSFGDAIMRARLPLHGGRALGFPGRVMISLGGIAVAALSVTGLMIWLRRRRRRPVPV